MIFGGAILFFKSYPSGKNIPSLSQNNNSIAGNIIPQNQGTSSGDSQNSNILNNFSDPLNRASERITKKPFGIYITPATSPVQPEKFQGYHTGTDFEIFPEELDADVSVKAVCSGKLLVKEYASGYGGVAVELCELENNPITVVYGHLKLSSINSKTNDSLNAGDTIGILGKGYSAETSGERKHLHLGFHKGSIINIKGYVVSKSGLSEWVDPCLYSC